MDWIDRINLDCFGLLNIDVMTFHMCEIFKPEEAWKQLLFRSSSRFLFLYFRLHHQRQTDGETWLECTLDKFYDRANKLKG